LVEVLVLIAWTRALAGKAASKGRSRWWGALLPVLWIGGECAGLYVGMQLDLSTLTLYGGMLLVAGVFGLAAYLLVSMLPAASEPIRAGGDGVENRFYDPTNPYSPPARDPDRRDGAQTAALPPTIQVRSGRRRGRRRTTAGST